MKSLSKIVLLLLMALLLSNCSSTNKFMVKGTDEYLRATDKILGEWGATSYTVDGKELLKSKYEKMVGNFDFLTHTVKFTLWVTEGTISEKLLDWKKQYPGITIDEYKITYTANWSIDDKTVYLTEPTTDLVIKGSGENFDGFYQWEKSKFEMAKSADDGSLLGSALGSIAQSATGTSDLFPEFSDTYKYEIFKDGIGFSLTDDDSRIVFKK